MNYFHKAFYVRYLIGTWIRFWFCFIINVSRVCASAQLLQNIHIVHFATVIWFKGHYRRLNQKLEIAGLIKFPFHAKLVLRLSTAIFLCGEFAKPQICFEICLNTWSILNKTMITPQFCDRLWETPKQRIAVKMKLNVRHRMR